MSLDAGAYVTTEFTFNIIHAEMLPVEFIFI
jgi:hypothetical protein